jgi:pseudoazurin
MFCESRGTAAAQAGMRQWAVAGGSGRSIMLKHLAIAATVALLACGVSFSAQAADHEVKMLNKGSNGETHVFEPAFLKIAPNDTVTFTPVDKGHDSQSIDGAIPDGAQPWKGGISKKITVRFSKPGLYGYECMPHYALGMVGLIQVGDDTSNLQAIKDKRMPPRAEKRMDDLLKQVQAK